MGVIILHNVYDNTLPYKIKHQTCIDELLAPILYPYFQSIFISSDFMKLLFCVALTNMTLWYSCGITCTIAFSNSKMNAAKPRLLLSYGMTSSLSWCNPKGHSYRVKGGCVSSFQTILLSLLFASGRSIY